MTIDALDALDALDAAMVEVPQTKTYFGEVVNVDAAFYVLKRGEAKRLWDATVDPVHDRRTEIEISIEPLRGQYVMDRKMMDFEKAWTNHGRPSLANHGESLKTIRGKFVQIEVVETGETYEKNGETKKKTAWVFRAVYADREACQAAADAFYGGYAAAPAPQPAPTPTPQPAPAAAPAANGGINKAALVDMLNVLWAVSGKDPNKLEQMIANTPMLAGTFTMDSPEVIALTGTPF